MTEGLDYPSEYTNIDQGDQHEFSTGILTLIKGLQVAQTSVTDYDSELKDAKASVTDFQQNKIPDFMGQAIEWKGAGWKVKIKEEMFCSIRKRPVDKSAEAYKHLEEIGHGVKVKRQISVNFGAGLLDDEMIQRIMPELEAKAKDLINVELKKAFPDRPMNAEIQMGTTYKVEAQTLKKIAKDRQEAGFKMPDDIFSCYPYRKADVKSL